MRHTISINGDWLFRRGDIAPEDAMTLSEGWQEVTLPHDWAIEGPFDGWNEPIPHHDPEKGLAFSPDCETAALPYIGCGVYFREFTPRNKEKYSRFRLEFDGVISGAYRGSQKDTQASIKHY